MERSHVLVGSIAVVALIAVAVAVGGGFLGGGGDDTSAAPTPTETPTPASTATPTARATATAAPTPTRQEELAAFATRVRGGIESAPRENISVPVLATEYRETENGTVLWVVFDEIEPDGEASTRNMQLSWQNVAITYARTVEITDGAQPDRLVAVGLNEELSDTHFVVRRDVAQRLATGEWNLTQFNDRWLDGLHGHERDHEVSQTAVEMMEAEGERTPTNSLVTDD